MSSETTRICYSTDELLSLCAPMDAVCDSLEWIKRITPFIHKNCGRKGCYVSANEHSQAVKQATNDIEIISRCPRHTSKQSSNCREDVRPQLSKKFPLPNDSKIIENKDSYGVTKADPNARASCHLLTDMRTLGIGTAKACAHVYIPQSSQASSSIENIRKPSSSTDLEMKDNKTTFEQFIKRLKENDAPPKEIQAVKDSTTHVAHQQPSNSIIPPPLDTQNGYTTNSQLNETLNCREAIHYIDPNCPIHSNLVKNPTLSFMPSVVAKRLSSQRLSQPSTEGGFYLNPWVHMKPKEHTQFFEKSTPQVHNTQNHGGDPSHVSYFHGSNMNHQGDKCAIHQGTATSILPECSIPKLERRVHEDHHCCDHNSFTHFSKHSSVSKNACLNHEEEIHCNHSVASLFPKRFSSKNVRPNNEDVIPNVKASLFSGRANLNGARPNYDYIHSQHNVAPPLPNRATYCNLHSNHKEEDPSQDVSFFDQEPKNDFNYGGHHDHSVDPKIFAILKKLSRRGVVDSNRYSFVAPSPMNDISCGYHSNFCGEEHRTSEHFGERSYTLEYVKENLL